ncbi:MAG: tape measure protein [Candidatus Thiodiazotropha sp. (ex Troendleina suluensis)]|nr:tape measure protein [Candidatus Thiodiazotropha sp. (ex Troendleina suluensis)]
MADRNQISLRIKTIVDGLKDIDKLISEIDNLGGQAGETGNEAKALNAEFQKLQKQQSTISQFEKLNQSISRTASDLDTARSKATKLGRAVHTVAKPTKTLTSAFERARASVRRLKEEQAVQLGTLSKYSNKMKAAGVDTRRLTAEQVRLANETAKIKGKISTVSNELKKTKSDYRSAGQAATRFGNAGATAGNAATAGIKKISSQLSSAKAAFLGFFGVRYAANMVKDLGGVADEWKNITARLDQASDSQEELASAQEATFALAQDARTSIKDVANLYSRLSVSLKDHNVTQEEALTLTESISKAMKVSGASATETSATITQLNQSFASGVLRGQEFNSVMEQGPRLAKALADGMDVPVTALRGMAEAGEISAERVKNALLDQSDAIRAEYEKLPLTIEGSVVRLENAWTRFIGQQDQAAGASGKVAEGLSVISEHLDEIASVALKVGEVMAVVFAVKGVNAIGAYITAAKSAAVATIGIGAAAGKSAGKVGLLTAAANLAASAFIGWEIGKTLSEKFEVVRVAGVAMVETLVRGAELVRTQWEIARAVFTDDTIDDALERHERRVSEMNETFKQMYIDARTAAEGQKELGVAVSETAEDLEREKGELKDLGSGLDDAATSAKKMAEAFENVGVNIDKYLSGLDSKATQQIKQLGVVMGNPALEGKPLIKFLRDLASNADNPRVVAESMRILSLVYEDGRLSTQQYDEETRRLAHRLKELNNSTLKSSASTTDYSAQMYALAEAFNAGAISAKEYYDRLMQLMELEKQRRQQQEEQREGFRRTIKGNKQVADSAKETADTVTKAEQEMDAERKKGLASFANFWKRVYDTYHSISATAGAAYDSLFEKFKRMGSAAKDYNTVLKLTHDFLKKLDVTVKAQAANAQGYASSLKDVIQEGVQAIRNMKILDAQKLNQLKAQIGQARAAMRALNEEARDTLSGLRQELASLQGDDLGAETLRYQQQLEDLQRQLADAQRAGSSQAANDLRQSINTLRQIHAQRIRDIRTERAAQNNAYNGQSAGPLPSNNRGGQGIGNNLVEIRFRGPGGETTSGYFPDGGVGNFINILRDSGATTE